MKTTFACLVAVGITLGLSVVISAKGETTKITVSGTSLATPIEMTDANTVRAFQVSTGPGTRVCVGGRGNCVEGTEGFIIDWPSGVVAQRPSGLQHYEVSFYVTDRGVAGQSGPEHLAYVVSYEYDPTTSRGYVYLPGKDDEGYALNSASIYRGREGDWFYASRAWQDAVVPLIARR